MYRSKLKELFSCQDHEGIVWCVCWDYSGRKLASCGQDRVIRIWSFDEAACSLTQTDKLCGAHSKTIRSVCFAPDGKRLAAASFDSTISIWKLTDSNWTCIANLEGHENEVKSVHWSPDGRLLASCGRDKTVWIWETGMDDDDFECLAVLADHNQDVKQVKWHPNDLVLASASYDDSVRLWTSDPMEDDWFATAALHGHDSTVWSLDFDLHGNYMASVSDDCSMVIWQRVYGANRFRTQDLLRLANLFVAIKYEPKQRVWNAHRRPVSSVSWYKGDNVWDEYDESEVDWPSFFTVATSSADKTISVWEAPRIPKTEEMAKFPTYQIGEIAVACKVDDAHEHQINCVVWHPLKPVLASSDDDGCIKIWSYTDA